MKKTITIFLFILYIANQVFANNDKSLNEFKQKNITTNQNAMVVLGSWAVGNILVGSYGNFTTTGVTKYFHQFNVMWNVVNLGLATFGYFNSVNKKTIDQSQIDIIKDFNSLQNFLLLNAGLDVAYIIAGFYLKEKSTRHKRSNLLAGYGNSLILQGSFLLLFDVSFFFINQHNANLYLYPYLDNLLTNDFSLGLGVKLEF